MDGQTYKCGWERSRDGWRAWLIKFPSIQGSGATLEAAEDSLRAAVCDRFGDGEPLFTYHPSLPVQPGDFKYLSRGLAVLQNIAYGWIAGNAGDYFNGEPCTACRRVIGPRNAVPFHESSPPEGDFCHRNQQDFHPFIATERFVSLLTEVELECLELREFVRPPGSRRKVYELIPRRFVEEVRLEHGQRRSLRCATCGFVVYVNTVEGSDIGRFVRDTDVASLPAPIFGVGTPGSYVLAMSASRASELAAHRYAKGAGVAELGTLLDSEVSAIGPGSELDRPATAPWPASLSARNQGPASR